MSDASSEMPGASPSNEERTWALASHLSGIVLGLLGPLIVWLIQKEKMPFVDDQGKEALNFQITVLIGYVVSFATACLYIGFVLMPVVIIGNIIFCILGAVAANRGEAYRYPVTLRLIK
ncbi:MAG: DUF4870 domain-containing protein [Planctomycetota bacterium]|jgi:uncharacterized Tic20 family protein